ncbi:MAG: cysteine peptidase family C39 domain-containing protein, partial [Acidobacteriota bacterium]
MRRRLFAPEVIQSSAMDCGPAALKALLEGHGIHVAYGRLREACQTDVDGTSIDSLEVVARQLGLDAEQVMLPSDHLLVPSANALPALLVVRLATGATHFVVAWRKLGPWVEVMDPATGRRFLTRRRFLAQVYRHRHTVPADAWREWAGTDEHCEPLGERLGRVGVSTTDSAALIEAARDEPSWRSIAALDAATRMSRELLDSGALGRTETARLVPRLTRRVREHGVDAIPEAFWSVSPVDDDGLALHLRGAVLVRVRGRRSGAGTDDVDTDAEPADQPEAATDSPSTPPIDRDTLPPELVAARDET